MAFAETANLAVKLTLGGNFTSQMGKARAQLRGLDKDSSRAYRAGGQIGTGIRNGAILAVAGLGALAGALAVAVKDGQDAANVQKIYAQAISNSGKVSADYVKILNDQQKALEDLGGVDDELIKSEQTRLIQMGLSGKATAALTPLILDASKATGKDLLTVTIAAGKAANGNATALQRLGIMVDKTRFKANPLAETIRVLNKRFGGTTQALSGSFNTRMDALQQHLKDIGENVGIKLLPALTKIVDVVGAKLVPAFGKFVDSILPDINAGLNDFADALSNGGAENAIKGITGALGGMVSIVQTLAGPVKAIVGAFLSLPQGVQTALIAGFAVNKLTGGLVTNVGGGIVEAIGKAFLGGVKAGVVNVQGGVVNVGGGVPGGGVPGVGGAAGKGLSGLQKVFLVGEAIGLVAAVDAVRIGIEADTTAHAQNISQQTKDFIASQPPPEQLRTSLDAVQTAIDKLQADPIGTALIAGQTLDELKKMRGDLIQALGQGNPSVPSLTSDRPIIVKLPPGVLQSKDPLTGRHKQGQEFPGKALDDALLPVKTSVLSAKEAIQLAKVDNAAVTNSGAATVASATAAGAASVAGAVRAIPAPITNVTTVVHISAAQVAKTIVIQKRYGPGNGSAGTSSQGAGQQGK